MKKKILAITLVLLSLGSSIACAESYWCDRHRTRHDGSSSYWCNEHNTRHAANGNYWCNEHRTRHSGFGCCHR